MGRLRHFFESSPAGQRVSSRFVAGFEVAEALDATSQLNREGLSVTLDSLGENVHTPEKARHSAAIYHQLLDSIAEQQLDANISVKLTQMGMDLGNGLAESIVTELLEHASPQKTFVRIDMEGSSYTQATLDLVHRLHRRFPGGIGVVIQSYLRSSEADVAALLARGIRIRLCKGAYREPASLAFPDKREVDANYMRLTGMLLGSGVYHGIATHDPKMIEATERLVESRGIDRGSFEFQMLYGIRRDLQRSLVARGYKLRVYVPFGREWYPYFMRRLAERPANVLFLARNFFRA